MRSRRRRRIAPRAPDRHLTRAARLAVRTSKRWVAGYPRLIAEWHPTKNVDLFPYEVTYASVRKIWWKCPNGPDHEWVAQPIQRTARGAGCPYCKGRRVSITNCLATIAPVLAMQWHPTRNGRLTPKSILGRTNQRVWWQCAKAPDHVWAATVNRRHKHPTCPFCAGRRLAKSTSLARISPAVARELHPTRNGKLNGRTLAFGSSRQLWWRCRRAPNHVWRARVSHRVQRGIGCPFCAGRELASENTLATVAPAVARQWERALNADVTPRSVSARSKRRVWWRCAARGHSFQTSVARMVRDQRCPYCEGWDVAADTSLAARHPELAAEWHASKNRKRPEDVSPRWTVRAWWNCPNGHVYDATVWERAVRGRGCPFCAGTRVSRTNCAASVPRVTELWHPTRNGAALKPSMLTKGSGKVVWWRCDANRRHVWSAQLRSVATGSGCPVCVGRAPRRR